MGGALAAYDLVATALLPLTDDLIARLAGLPLAPVLAWGGVEGRWVGLGLGELLMATSFPLVLRRAYGRPAGAIAAALGLLVVAGLLGLGLLGLLPGTFPVMVLLGPLMVAQHALWRRRLGAERRTWQYLEAEPGPGPSAIQARAERRPADARG